MFCIFASCDFMTCPQGQFPDFHGCCCVVLFGSNSLHSYEENCYGTLCEIDLFLDKTAFKNITMKNSII